MTHDSLNPGTVIKLRRDTAANWTTDNPVLAEGETGWETDTRRVKLGDGTTAWTDLPYAADEAASVTAEQDRAEAAETVLQDNIDAEQSARETADNGLSGRLDVVEAAQAVRKGTLFYTENTCSLAGLVTTITTVATPIPGMVGVIQPTTADVWLRWGANIGISVVGAGLVTMRLYEITDAGTALVKSGPIVREVAAGFVTAFGPTISGQWRLGPTTTTRQFYCDVILAREAGSSLAAYLLNSYNNGAGAELAKTWFAAVAS